MKQFAYHVYILAHKFRVILPFPNVIDDQVVFRACVYAVNVVSIEGEISLLYNQSRPLWEGP